MATCGARQLNLRSAPTIAFAALLLICSLVISDVEAQHARRPRGIALEPLFSLTTHAGMRLSPADVQGRPFGVVFGFTHCPDVCPTMLLDWSNVLESLGPDGNRFRVLFVSVDSERDTPEALRAYMSAFDPRIIALTGSSVEIAAVAHTFDAFYEKVDSKDGGSTFDHTVKTYLMDRYGLLVGKVDPNTAERHRRTILSRLLAQ